MSGGADCAAAPPTLWTAGRQRLKNTRVIGGHCGAVRGRCGLPAGLCLERRGSGGLSDARPVQRTLQMTPPDTELPRYPAHTDRLDTVVTGGPRPAHTDRLDAVVTGGAYWTRWSLVVHIGHGGHWWSRQLTDLASGS